jgi:ribosomal protein S27E
LSGPHFFGLPVDLRFSKTEVHFWQRELITGNDSISHASIDHIAVYSLGLKNFILTNSKKEQVFYRFIQSKLQKMNAASLLVSTIKRIRNIQALEKLKAGNIVQSRFLRIYERKRYQMLILKNAVSLLVSTIKRNHDIQALQKLKAGNIVQSRFLRIYERKRYQMLILKNAASLLVSAIKRIRNIQALKRLKAGKIVQSRFLRIKSTNVVEKLIAFDKEIQVVNCGVCLEPLVSNTLKILPCGHVICDVCFPQIIFPLKCPHCRNIFQFAQCKNGEQIVLHFSGPTPNQVFLS